MASLAVSSLPLSPSIRDNLRAHGFTLCRDLLSPCPIKPSELAKELRISFEEARNILEIVQHTNHHSIHSGTSSSARGDENVLGNVPSPLSSLPSTVMGSSRSALSLFEAGSDGLSSSYSSSLSCPGSIFTLCQKLDALLGEGVSLQQVTEFCGTPGIGKTQLCLQLAVDTAIPLALGGADGQAIYVDTEGSFMPHRCFDIAQGLCAHLAKIQSKRSSGHLIPSLTPQTIMSGIFVFRVFDHVEQSAILSALPRFLEDHPRVRLLIVDSIAFHFRRGFSTDFGARSRLLTHQAHQLQQMARQFNLAVVLINQVTTRVLSFSAQSSHIQSSNQLAPALGESWAHACTNRVLLYWQNGQRRARLLKSPSRRLTQCAFRVAEQGIRDMPSDPNQVKRKAEGDANPEREKVQKR